MTQTGLSLGTPQYMSPEQAMGERQITPRSDIYSLGAMTYEMLAGEPPFVGPNAQAIVAQVLTSEPVPLTVKRRSVPEHVSAAVATALEKLPADRFGSAAAFSAALAGGSPTDRGSRRVEKHRELSRRSPAIAWSVAAVSLLVALGAAGGWLRASSAARHREVTRFRIPVAPPGDDGAQIIAISPDGRTIAYTDRSASDKEGIYLRRLDRPNAELLAGTGRADALVFSPDGGSIAYTTFDTEVRVIPVAGGASVPVTRGAAWFGGIDWGSDGYLYFASNDSGVIMRVRATGGSSESVSRLETTKIPFGFKADQSPRLIGGGTGVAFSVYRGPGRSGDIGVVDLKTHTSRFIAKGAAAVGVRAGYLLYVTDDGTLEAIPFDEQRLEARGTPAPLATGVFVSEARAQAALAHDGTLIYIAAMAPESQLVWVSREGVESPLGGIIDKSIGSVAISPAGDRVALGEGDQKSAVWLYDIRNQTLSAFAHAGPLDNRPRWTPDGLSIVFVSDRGSQSAVKSLWIQPLDGRDTARLLVASPRHAQEISWVAKSPWVVYREGFDDARTGRDLRYFRPGSDTTTHAYLATKADELNPALAPDGRWLAYVSNESGRDEVYIGPFPGPGAPTQVSDAGGTGPLWSHDGRTLFYRALDGRFMSVDVSAGARLELSNRRALFSTLSYVSDRTHPAYDVAPGDRRFLFVKPSSEPALDVVVHWFDEARPRLERGR